MENKARGHQTALLELPAQWHSRVILLFNVFRAPPFALPATFYHLFQIIRLRKVGTEYTGSLVAADFSGAVFTFAHFQKIAQISSLCNCEGNPSLMCFRLLITQVLRIQFMWIFVRPKKITSQGPGAVLANLIPSWVVLAEIE